MVERQPNGDFRLGSGVLELGQRALERFDIREIAGPYMRELSRATGETIHLAVKGDDDVVYLDKVDSTYPMRMYSRVGIIAPLHCTGVAKAIMAFLNIEERERLVSLATYERFNEHTLTSVTALRDDLEQVRQRGYAIDDQEHELGIHCIAAPVLNADGSVAASISIATPISRLDRKQLLELVPLLCGAARRASADLGYTPREASAS